MTLIERSKQYVDMANKHGIYIGGIQPQWNCHEDANAAFESLAEAIEKKEGQRPIDRITGQCKTFIGNMKAVIERHKDKADNIGFIFWVARREMEKSFGKENVVKMVHIEDYTDFSNYDYRITEAPKATMAVCRFINPRTGRYYFEQVTVLKLTPEDYENLNLEAV